MLFSSFNPSNFPVPTPSGKPDDVNDDLFFLPLNGLDQASALRSAIAEAKRKDLHMVVIGDFNNGKSTLLNALLGRRLLISSLVPATGPITFVRFGSDEHMVVERPNGGTEKYPIDQIQQKTVIDDLDEDIPRVTIHCRCSVLGPDLVLVDTPGTNDTENHTSRALEALRTADAILWVIRADYSLKQQERELADQWVADNPNARLVPVVNCMNLVPDRDKAAVAQRIESQLHGKFGSRVTWVKALTGKSYFEINALKALDWSADGMGEPEEDFLALTGFLGELKDKSGVDIIQHSRPGWLRTFINTARRNNSLDLERLKKAASEVGRTRDNHRRQSETQARQFEAKTEVYFAAIVKDANEYIPKLLDRLLYFWYNNESVSSLRDKRNRWGNDRLTEAAKNLVAACNVSCKTLAAEFGLSSAQEMSVSDLPVEFHISMPESGFFDDLLDLVSRPATSDFVYLVRNRGREEWGKRSSAVMAGAEKWWQNQTKKMLVSLQQQGEQNLTSVVDGWSWEVTPPLVDVKAWEIWLQRWNEPPPWGATTYSGHDAPERIQALNHLHDRVSSGAPLRGDLLQHEAAATALDTLFARYAGKNGNGA